MPRTIVRPAKLDLDSPGRRDYFVALEHDSMWADHLIPLTVFVGPKCKEGQGLSISGSNHGNEYEGPVALKHMLGQVDIKNVTGRIIIIPVLNPAAFKSGTRKAVTEDNVNLNRAFVDGAGVNPAIAGISHRIAKFMRDYIWPRTHAVIDLHAGGCYEFVHCASYHPLEDAAQHAKTVETARWFGTPAILTYQNVTPGLLPSEAERLGKITVGTELGWGEAVSPEGVMYGRQGAMAAAIHLGMLRGKISPIAHHKSKTQKFVSIVDRECYTVAPVSGHYEPFFHVGEMVKKGQTVGLLHDFERIDAPAFEVKAGVSGMLVAQGFSAATKQGVHIAVVGQVYKG